MAKQSVAGVVVKVNESVIVLLCQDGMFKNVARPAHTAPPLIGERYTHIEKATSWLKYTSIAAVFLLTFVSYLLLPFGQDDSAYVVAIDINPSIELTVNDAMKVIETSANNPDGETLLTEMGLYGVQLSIAIEKITTYSEDSGFFLEGKYLTTSVIPVGQKNHLIEEVEQIIETSIGKPDIDVVVFRNDKATYDEAKKNNLSVNHYAYYKELQNDGVVETIEEIKGKSIAELRKMQKNESRPVEKSPGDFGSDEQQENSNKPDRPGPPHEDKGKGASRNGFEQNKSSKQNSVDPSQQERERGVSPSQVQENNQQAENRKDVQVKRAPQNKGQDNENNNENSSMKAEGKQKELPKANENNRSTPANNGQ